jgi:hypothetical protein
MKGMKTEEIFWFYLSKKKLNFNGSYVNFQALDFAA